MLSRGAVPYNVQVSRSTSPDPAKDRSFWRFFGLLLSVPTLPMEIETYLWVAFPICSCSVAPISYKHVGWA